MRSVKAVSYYALRSMGRQRMRLYCIPGATRGDDPFMRRHLLQTLEGVHIDVAGLDDVPHSRDAGRRQTLRSR